MSYKQFDKNDIFHNVIKAYPEVKLYIAHGSIVYATEPAQLEPVDTALNPSSSSYQFTTKDGSLFSWRTISTSSFNSDFNYGDIISSSVYPLISTILPERFATGQSRTKVKALQNYLNFYKFLSPHCAYSSSLGNKETQELGLISIPSILYGSGIRKGSVSLKLYVTGTLAGELVDDKRNGELRQSYPEDANSGSVAGIAMYKEGFLFLTGSWSIISSHTEDYGRGLGATAPRWIDFAFTGSTAPSSSFSIDYQGTQRIPVLTMLAHANRGELNYSNNPTFIEYDQTGSLTPLSGTREYREFGNLSIKNIAKSNFVEPTASFEKTTYISGLGIYDKNKNLIARVKLAEPVRKKEIDSYTFKIKVDL